MFKKVKNDRYPLFYAVDTEDGKICQVSMIEFQIDYYIMTRNKNGS